MDSMFETLVDLPLFRGVTRERMAELIERAKFNFLKYMPDNDIVTAGQSQTHLNFILSGSVRMRIAVADDRFAVSSTVMAPDVIAPEFLFGRHTDYPCTARAIDTVSILSVSKSDYMDMLARDEIFMLNYLNHLSMNAQRGSLGVLALASGSLEERLAYWIVALTQHRATEIVLHCRLRDLCAMVGVQRSKLEATLDAMRARAILNYDSAGISFNNRRELVSLLTHSEIED